MWKVFIREYLSFSKKERVGIFLLLSLILACMLFPLFFRFINKKKNDNPGFDREITSLKTNADTLRVKKYVKKNFDTDEYNTYDPPSEKNYHNNMPAENFYFDPNTASTADWQRLGIKDKTIQTIQKYLSRGGHFYHPEDINKIWGLSQEDIKRLLHYVRLKALKRNFTPDDHPQSERLKNRMTYSSKPIPGPFDINTADTTLFIALTGIGTKLAQRIINFREKLGGFCSINQLGETFGLPDSTFQKIKPKLMLNNLVLKQININTATLDEMKMHPYIRYNLANAIIQYRTQHGNFLSVSDVKKMMLVSEDIYYKLAPYLSVGL
jgi:competence protein ComEA